MQAYYEPRNQLVYSLLCCSVIASLCTINSDTLCDSVTLSSSKPSRIEVVRHFCDGEKDLCASSQTPMNMFAVQEEDTASMLINHKKIPVRLHVIAVKRHVSDIELDEIPDEYE